MVAGPLVAILRPRITLIRGVDFTGLDFVRVLIDLRAGVAELVGHVEHALLGEIPDLLRDLHRAEFRTAHGAEMRHLRAFRR